MECGSTDSETLTRQLWPDEGREAALIDAVSLPPVDGAGLTVVSSCSLIWTGMQAEIVDDSGKSLGWSHAGIVERVHSCLGSWTPGERISGVGHGSEDSSRTIFIPAGLAAKVPLNIGFKGAVFGAPGALAVRAVRLAGIKKGETVAVIGLGLTGRLTCKLLTMIGCRVLGLDGQDRDENFDRIQEVYRLFAIDKDPASKILDMTSGQGAHAVIVTDRLELPGVMESAGLICTENAKVVAVGLENRVFPGDVFQERNLTLVSTGSYGSGQDDSMQEISQGTRDPSSVRLTPNYGLLTFLDLMSGGRVEVESLITHRFDIGGPVEAREIISDLRGKQHLGVLLNYARAGIGTKAKLALPKRGSIGPVRSRGVTMGLIGADDVLEAEQSGFELLHSRVEDLITDPEVDSIYISNVHNKHFERIVKSLLSGKATLVEKCLCLNEGELEQIEAAWLATGAPLLAGYSRRFAPLVAKIREILKSRRYPLSVYYRINPGPAMSANQDGSPQDDYHPIMENMCDHMDLLSFLIGGRPTRIYTGALSMPDDRYRCDDNLQVMIRYSDGSVGTVNYVTSGDSLAASEYLEILGDGMVIRLDNFSSLAVESDGKLESKEIEIRDTGRTRMLQLWRYYLVTGLGSPISFEDLKYTSLAAFGILESLEDGSPARLVD